MLVFFYPCKSYRGSHTLLSKNKIILVRPTKKGMLLILIKPKRNIYNRRLKKKKIKKDWLDRVSFFTLIS